MKEYLDTAEKNFAEESAFAEGLAGAAPEMNGAGAPWTEEALAYFFDAAEKIGLSSDAAADKGLNSDAAADKGLNSDAAGNTGLNEEKDRILSVRTSPGDAAAVLFAVKALKNAGVELPVAIRVEPDDGSGRKKRETAGRDSGCGHDDGAGKERTVSSSELRTLTRRGVLTFDIVRKFSAMKTKGLALRSLDGDGSPDSRARRARAVVNSPDAETYDIIRAKAAEYNSPTSPVKCRGTGKSLEILSEFKEGAEAPESGNAPEGGKTTGSECAGGGDARGDAIAVLTEFLGRLNFASEEINDTVAFYNDHIGSDTDGSRIGCAVPDDASGALEWNTWRVRADERSVTFSTRVIYPVSSSPEDVYAGIAEITDRYGMGIVKIDDEPSLLPVTDDCGLQELTKHYADALRVLASEL